MIIKEVIKQNSQALLELPNVVGVGQGTKIINGVETDKAGVVVMVEKKKPLAALAVEVRIPGAIQGVVTDVIEVGYLRAFSNVERVRPLQGGYSIGHYKITAGTLGCVVYDGTTEDPFLLSNNHVLANSNNAAFGDQIIQPGFVDGGNPSDDLVGFLSAFCPLDFGEEPSECNVAGFCVNIGNTFTWMIGSKHRIAAVKKDAQAMNQIDAALAKPVVEVVENIKDIGIIHGVADAFIGMSVCKSGRTTGFTAGTINLVHATVSVDYGEGKVALFEDQLVSGAMSQGGDSGSLLVSAQEVKAVGLLYAGSSQVTLYNPISHVLDYFGVYFRD